jgi:hypothetical protein
MNEAQLEFLAASVLAAVLVARASPPTTEDCHGL